MEKFLGKHLSTNIKFYLQTSLKYRMFSILFSSSSLLYWLHSIEMLSLSWFTRFSWGKFFLTNLLCVIFFEILQLWGCYGFCVKVQSLRRHSMLDVSHKHLCCCLIKIKTSAKLLQKKIKNAKKPPVHAGLFGSLFSNRGGGGSSIQKRLL